MCSGCRWNGLQAHGCGRQVVELMLFARRSAGRRTEPAPTKVKGEIGRATDGKIDGIEDDAVEEV